MSGIKVTPDQLRAVSGQLASGAANIEGTLGQLTGTVAPLGSDWAGVAQARFQELWNQWQKSAKTLNEALIGMSRLMQQAGQAYQSTEDAVARAFGPK
jgi:WXG100 family type VII secretion target